MVKVKDNSITLNNVTAGISNDEYGFVGSVFDARWVNIRENSHYYSLGNWAENIVQISNSTADVINSIYVPSTVYWMYASNSGKIYGYLNNANNWWWEVFKYWPQWETAYMQIFTMWNYGIVLSRNYIHRRIYDSNSTSFWLLGGDPVVNWDFATDSDWTKGTGWTIDTWTTRANHAAGSASDLSQTLTVTNNAYYRVSVQWSVTAWTLTVKMWWTTIWTITATGSIAFVPFWRTTTSTSEALVFSASADFVWYISFVSVNKTNMQESVTSTPAVVNGTFDTDVSWTKWTWRTIPWGAGAQHASGTGSDLSQTLAVKSWVKYRIVVEFTKTSWTSLVVKMWWDTQWTLTASWTYTYTRTAESTSELLAFTASSDLVASIDNVTVDEIITLGQSYHHPYIISSPYLYIGGKNIVTKIDTSTSPRTNTNELTLPTDEEIRWMTNIWTRFYIYTNRIDWTWARQYLWDWFSAQPDETIERPRKTILWVQNNWNFDYVVTWVGQYRELYKVSWRERVKLFQSWYIDNFSTYRFAFIDWTNVYNPMTIVRDLVYIAWNSGLWKYWAELPWLPESLSKTIGSSGTYRAVTSDLEGSNIYYSAITAAKPYVYYITRNDLNRADGNSYCPQGWIEYNPILRDRLSSIKRLEKLQIGYQLQWSQTNIKIYVKIDDWSYTLIKTITGTGSTVAYGRSNVVTQDWITANAGTKFYKIQFKVELNTTSGSLTPKIFDLSLRVDWTSDVF